MQITLPRKLAVAFDRDGLHHFANISWEQNMRRAIPIGELTYAPGDSVGKVRRDERIHRYLATDPYRRMQIAVDTALQTDTQPIFFDGEEVVLAAMDYLTDALEHESERQFWGWSGLNVSWSEYRDDPVGWERFVYAESLVPYVYLYQSLFEGCDTDQDTLKTFLAAVQLQIEEVATRLNAPQRPCFAIDHHNPPPGWHLSHATSHTVAKHEGQAMAVIMSGPFGAVGQPTADCGELITSHTHKPQLRGSGTSDPTERQESS